MKVPVAGLLVFALVFLGIFSYAQNPDQGEGNEFDHGFENDFSEGLPQASAADQDYVARASLTSAMASAYTWIGDNATEFVAGCRGERQSLVSRLAGVIKQSGEASTACALLKSEADACTPSTYCPALGKGKMPFPSHMKSQFEKAGINVSELSLDQINAAMMEKVCAARFKSEIDKQKEKQEEMRQKVKEKLSEFRQKCEGFKKRRAEQENRGFEDFRFPELPDFGPPGQGQPHRDGCSSPPPRCPGDARSWCKNDRWECEPAPPQHPQEQQAWQQPRPPMEPQPRREPVPPQETHEPSEPEEADAEPQETEDEPSPEPAEEPEPTEPAEAAAQRVLAGVFPITGFVTGVEEPPQPYPQEQASGTAPYPPNPPYGQYEGGQPGQGYGSQPYPQPQPPYRPENRPGGGGGGYRQEGQPSQQGPPYGGSNQGGQGYGSPGPGPSPEQLCDMSDDEILDAMMSQTPFDGMEQQGSRCKEEATRIVQDLASVKLRLAECKARAAVMCAAKKEAASECQSSVQDPEKIASRIISQMCQKSGVLRAEKVATPAFQDVVTQFYDRDPALANQLGDAVEETQSDQQRLGILSKLFGDGDYAQRIRGRAESLAAIRAKLAADENIDPKILDALDEQVKQLNGEADQFANILNMARLGKLFG